MLRLRLVVGVALGLACSSAAWAWHGEGHDLAARKAISILPADMPVFFRDGSEMIAHTSLDPDLFTKPIAAPQLHDAEAPEHYFDLEKLDGVALPPGRYDLLKYLYAHDLEPAKVGLAPYAITENTQRLAVCFAEYRKWPQSKEIQVKCLLHAGILAHYAADLCQPLHTTIHYDGRIVPGQPTQKGIHKKVDALLGKLPPDVSITATPTDVRPMESLWDGVVEQLMASYAMVDRVYEMEPMLPAYEQPLDVSSPAGEFARERLSASSLFIARLYATAWRDSADISLPEFHKRPATQPARPQLPTTKPATQPHN